MHRDIKVLPSGYRSPKTCCSLKIISRNSVILGWQPSAMNFMLVAAEHSSICHLKCLWWSLITTRLTCGRSEYCCFKCWRGAHHSQEQLSRKCYNLWSRLWNFPITLPAMRSSSSVRFCVCIHTSARRSETCCFIRISRKRSLLLVA